MALVYINTHPLHGIPSPERYNFPLVIARSTNNRLRKRTRQSVSLLKALGRTTTHLPRVFVGVEVGPNEGSGSCGIPASVFRLRGWRRNRWSSAGSWLAEKVRQHGENAQARVTMGVPCIDMSARHTFVYGRVVNTTLLVRIMLSITD